MRFLILLLPLLLTLLLTLPLAAAEIGFKEQFADPGTRKAALESLVPGTRDWFFYHALDHQLAGRDIECRATLQHWQAVLDGQDEASAISSAGLSTLGNRAALLRYQQQPEAALAELTGMLGLEHGHARPDARTGEDLPTRLDPQAVSAGAFEAAAKLRTKGQPWREAGNGRLLSEIADPAGLSVEQRRWLLDKLDFAHHPLVLPLVAADLGTRDAKPFGEHKVHRLLSAAQLEELRWLKPEVLQNDAFVRLFLKKLSPGSETDFALDRSAHAAHLANCRDFAVTLPPAFNSLKAHVLHHHLRLQRELGNFPKNDFINYLALPRKSHPVLRSQPPDDQAPCIAAGEDFGALTGCPPVGDDEEFVRSLLDHFLANAESADEFAPFIPEERLRGVHARARLLAGGDPGDWADRLDPAEITSLQQETRIEFAPGQPLFFAPGAPVALTLDLKHTPELLVRIHELDPPAYVARHGCEPPLDLDLGGLVPHTERTLRYDQPRLLRHRETIALPELQGRGAWIVEFISRGVASRALVRKGRLIPHATPTAAGMVVRTFDEDTTPVPDATLTLGSETLAADENGLVTVPATMLQTTRTAVVAAPGATPESAGLAVPLTLDALPADDIELSADFHIDRESLAAGRNAGLRVEPRLTRHGHPIPLELLLNPTVTLSAKLLGGATVERVIGGDLKPGKAFTVTFNVPTDARSLTFRLAGKVEAEPGTQPLDRSAERTVGINGILDTPRIAAAFFTPTSAGHLLEIRGRNGEAVPERAVTLAFHHRDFDEPLKLRLRSDARGRIELGPLPGIDWVDTSSDWLEETTYDPGLQLRHAMLPARLHVASGEELRLPLATPPAALDPARHSLIEFSSSPDLPLRDHYDKLALAKGMLAVKPLPPGSYLLDIDGDTCRIEVTAGTARGDLFVSPSRILPRLRPATPQVVRAAAEDGSLVVQLAGHGPDTRVALVGTTFAQEWPAQFNLGSFSPPPPPSMVPGFTSSGYQVGRILDEETRYILERRSAATFPGSLLPRPGLLVNRFTEEESEGSVLPPLPGEDAGKSDGSRRQPVSRESAEPTTGESIDESHPSIDFLAQGPVVRYDLKPAADGTVRIPLAEFAGCRLVSAIALDGGGFFQAAVPLDNPDPKLRDRRLANPLDSAKHHTGTRRATVLEAGAEALVENVLDAEWRAFTTLADVHSYFHGANPDPRISDFAFLTKWPKLDENRKLALLAEHACHEFHLFLARKDPAFFDQHVKPTLAEKLEPRFIDDYLLGRDLQPYLRPYAWGRLNAAEKALLAQALPAARTRVLTELKHRWEIEAPAPEQETVLFTRTLRGADLAVREVPGLGSGAADLSLGTGGTSYLLQKLRSIIIPVVDFEDTSVEEAIDFLRARSIELDTVELDPSRKGFNWVIRKPKLGGADAAGDLGLGGDPGTARIDELRLRNVPIATVLKYICDATRLRYKVDDFAVTLVPATETSEDLFTRSFQVPPDFVSALEGGDSAGEVDPFAPEPTRDGALKPRKSIEEMLKDHGISFPDGASVSYNPMTSILVVRNSPTNLDVIEQLTDACRCAPPSHDDQLPTARGFAGGGGDGDLAWSDADASIDPFAPTEYEPPELPNSVGTGRSITPLRSAADPRLGPTRIWREHNYYEYSGPTGEDLAPLNQFWIDLAGWDGKGRFLSPHFNACVSTPNEALLCLALLDLPFEAPQPEIEADGRSLRVRARQPLLLFFKDTRETDQVAADAPLLVRQGFHRHDDRFRSEAGRQVENSVEGEFLTGVPYASSLVVTNPTGASRRVDVLAQIPAGAIPLAGHLPTLSDTREIEPYGVLSLETAFYFPAAGSFPVYPLHVAEEGTILAHAAPRTLEVTAKPAAADRASWPAVARDGSPAEVVARLRADNLNALDLDLILWRLQDRGFFSQVAGILRERLHFHPAVFAYGFLHNDTPAIRDYLENSTAISQLGGWLESPLLDIRPTVHLNWETLEFDPLVNPRRHRFADNPRITHQEARDHYEALLDTLAWKPALDAHDQLVLTWFLLLQDRVEEALERFAKIEVEKLPGRLIYDYLHCHILFYQAKAADARAVAAGYAAHPLALWRDRFATVVAQADEIAAAANPQQAPPAAPDQAAPSLDLAPAADGSLTISHQRLRKTTLRLYGVDLEHLFSANPFLDQHDWQHAAVRPNHVIEVALDGDAGTTRVELPPAFRHGNVLVTADAGRLRTVRILDSQALQLRRDPVERTIQALATADGKPLPRCYVKIYAEMNDGGITYYKDGYTDLRGKFEYLAHTALDPATVKRLAVLVSHPDLGSRTEILKP